MATPERQPIELLTTTNEETMPEATSTDANEETHIHRAVSNDGTELRASRRRLPFRIRPPGEGLAAGVEKDEISIVLPHSGGIHRVGNLATSTAVSMHPYGPQLGEVDGRDYEPSKNYVCDRRDRAESRTRAGRPAHPRTGLQDTGIRDSQRLHRPHVPHHRKTRSAPCRRKAASAVGYRRAAAGAFRQRGLLAKDDAARLRLPLHLGPAQRRVSSGR